MLEADYLIVGSGAVGMAFADVLLHESDATMIIVDRYAKPGGHWNVAYPFVTLHQPSSFYGVSSSELSKGLKDQVGLNKGMSELASGAEVSAYFDDVMKRQMLPSGRVQYFPMSDYKGNGKFVSMLTGEMQEVKVNKKVIDCTFLNTSVPSTHKPNFTISEEAQFMPLNELTKIKTAPAGFVVVGGGKTAIDACLWLLENRVDPDKITWIVSRDAWLIDRRTTQPLDEFFEHTLGNQANQFEALAAAESIPDLFNKLEAKGVLLRIDKSVTPQMFHGATVSQLEIEELRRIKNVIRKGKVTAIEANKIMLERGEIPTATDVIHVDCSASAIPNLTMKPVFEDGLITPQTVRSYQPVFSAALIAHVELTKEDDKAKNKLCQVVPLPNHDTDWLRMMQVFMMNQFTWSQDKELRAWLLGNRLDGFSQIVKRAKGDPDKDAIMLRVRKSSMPAMMKLQQLIAELDKKEIQMTQFQVRRDDFTKTRIVDVPASYSELAAGEIIVRVEGFAFTANNLTYAVTGDRIGYWQFFPAVGTEAEKWGVIPVWGFAEVTASNCDEVPVGDRLFGYFPPSGVLKMAPVKVNDGRFIDGVEHRSKLPAGYNLYSRVLGEKNYNPLFDRERMMFFPLYLTSYCLWDSLKFNEWYGAKRVVILSASSKTSIGLAYGLKDDPNAPSVVGVTSERNLDLVKKIGIYDEILTYDEVIKLDPSIPTAIVDMSGNQGVLAALHQHLGENMRKTINVGLTHWTAGVGVEGINKERSEFFFAPSHMQMRIKEWGPGEFQKQTGAYVMKYAQRTREWLDFRTIDGLDGLARVYQDVCDGNIAPDEGLIVSL